MMQYSRIIFLPVFALTVSAQVYMPNSPIVVNPANMQLQFDSSQVFSPTFIISPVANQIQGSCYFTFSDTWAGQQILLYKTSSGSPDYGSPQVGGIGWSTTLSNSYCSIDLSSTTWDVYSGLVVRITTATSSAKQSVGELSISRLLLRMF